MRVGGLGGEAGFTLLEVLAALVVFGFVMAGLSQGMRFGLAAWDRQARGSEVRGDRDAVARALRGMVARLDPAVAVGGRAHALAFAADLPAVAALPDHEADLLLFVDPRHRLLLRWTPHLHAKRLAGFAGPQEVELLSGIERVDFGYWARTGAGGWLDSWRGDEPPALIRIRLSAGPGGPGELGAPAGPGQPHGSDIVVATMRQRLGGNGREGN